MLSGFVGSLRFNVLLILLVLAGSCASDQDGFVGGISTKGENQVPCAEGPTRSYRIVANTGWSRDSKEERPNVIRVGFIDTQTNEDLLASWEKSERSGLFGKFSFDFFLGDPIVYLELNSNLYDQATVGAQGYNVRFFTGLRMGRGESVCPYNYQGDDVLGTYCYTNRKGDCGIPSVSSLEPLSANYFFSSSLYAKSRPDFRGFRLTIPNCANRFPGVGSNALSFFDEYLDERSRVADAKYEMVAKSASVTLSGALNLTYDRLSRLETMDAASLQVAQEVESITFKDESGQQTKSHQPSTPQSGSIHLTTRIHYHDLNQLSADQRCAVYQAHPIIKNVVVDARVCKAELPELYIFHVGARFIAASIRAASMRWFNQEELSELSCP